MLGSLDNVVYYQLWNTWLGGKSGKVLRNLEWKPFQILPSCLKHSHSTIRTYLMSYNYVLIVAGPVISCKFLANMSCFHIALSTY